MSADYDRQVALKRLDDIVHLLWVVTRSLESRADGDPSAVLDRNEVKAAYNLFNDIDLTSHRPAWETRPKP